MTAYRVSLHHCYSLNLARTFVPSLMYACKGFLPKRGITMCFLAWLSDTGCKGGYATLIYAQEICGRVKQANTGGKDQFPRAGNILDTVWIRSHSKLYPSFEILWIFPWIQDISRILDICLDIVFWAIQISQYPEKYPAYWKYSGYSQIFNVFPSFDIPWMVNVSKIFPGYFQPLEIGLFPLCTRSARRFLFLTILPITAHLEKMPFTLLTWTGAMEGSSIFKRTPLFQIMLLLG